MGMGGKRRQRTDGLVNRTGTETKEICSALQNSKEQQQTQGVINRSPYIEPEATWLVRASARYSNHG